MKRLTILFAILALLFGGCQFIPEVTPSPQVRNPFPQLSRVAIVPFANQTPNDQNVDGLEVALKYFSQLQTVQGFEVLPPDVVIEALSSLKMTVGDLKYVQNRLRLADVLKVDVLVLGAVTEFTPYYPPRMGLQVSWYATNPCFHPIPPGYGLSWGTVAQEDIPDNLVYEAEFALAKEQLKTQTPIFPRPDNNLPAAPINDPDKTAGDKTGTTAPDETQGTGGIRPTVAIGDVSDVSKVNASGDAKRESELSDALTQQGLRPSNARGQFPQDWPDPRGFIPQGPKAQRDRCIPNNKPVIEHTRMYHANDPKFMAALRDYYNTRDEARFGGHQSYLMVADDFMRFCCHLHISEMLTARGGGGKTGMVWRWSKSR